MYFLWRLVNLLVRLRIAYHNFELVNNSEFSSKDTEYYSLFSNTAEFGVFKINYT